MHSFIISGHQVVQGKRLGRRIQKSHTEVNQNAQNVEGRICSWD
jgi:hypothetical protein